MDAEITRDAIAATERLIRAHVRRTPTLALDPAEFGLAAGALHVKLEFLQHSGSFKARGAFAHMLGRDVPPAGVAAASGGNHGAAVGYAASRLGLPARVFVPTVASPAKLERIRSYGAELMVGGDRYADALAAMTDFAASAGVLTVHAYDERETLLGQGTLGSEVEEQLPDIDTLLVAVGGGGLIGGIAAWFGGRVSVVGVEPEEAPTLHRALQAGRPVDAPAGGIAADSLAPRQVGRLMFPIAQRHVARSVLVADDAIAGAQRALWDRLRVVVEPGGAAAFAALLSGAYRPRPDERVAVLLCGANTAAVDFGR